MKNHYSKPQWLLDFEQRLGSRIRLHPNVLTLVKLLVLTPAILLPLFLFQPVTPAFPIILLFLLFGIIDYLDGLTARVTQRVTPLGQWLDRIADLPLLLGLSVLVFERVHVGILLAKIGVELLLLLVFIIGRSTREMRLRSSTNFIALFTLLMLALELHEKFRFITPELAEGALLVSTLVSFIMLGRAAGFLRKHLIADALSASNLICGLLSIYMATKGRLDLSLLFIGLGAAFDGLDGAAARKFGSTKWGVYSDDIADGVTYGIAPGVIIAIHMAQTAAGGLTLDGVIIGFCYALFTIGRLVFFTLNKSNSDPDYFMGAPSVLGGLLVISSAYLFKQHYTLVAMMVGVACVLMVAFDTRYRHMGRLIGSRQSIRWVSLASVLLIIILGFFQQITLAIGLIWAGCVIYGFLPMVISFKKAISSEQ